MQKKIEELEKLIYEACQKINSLEEENYSLSDKLEVKNNKLTELAKSKEELAKLINWKKKTYGKLTKLKNKIEFLIGQSKKG
jgi:chromosome segregation ATPase